jgi:steroid 5-alpha reductase family enzyme
LGLAIWIFGFVFECVGDQQLRMHISDQTPGKKKFITWGLWRYTRHPNYFGEAVLWWGIWVIACSNQYGWATFFAPLFISILVRYISGVPLLEKKYEERQDWKEYCHETNCFIPWFVNRKPNPHLLQENE